MTPELSPNHIDALIADIEAKADAAARAAAIGASDRVVEMQSHAAACYWAAPALIAEIRRLRAELASSPQ